MKFRKHVFICTNQRINGERCCGENTGMELVQAFKKSIKEKGLHVEIRAQRAGCIDTCDFGPSVVVYPEGVFYGGVRLSDVEEIIQQHLVEDKPVQRLVIDFSKKNPVA